MTALIEGDEFTFHIESDLDTAPTGFDSVIIGLPGDCGVISAPGKVMLDVVRLTKIVEAVARYTAEQMNETLLKAEFILTFDPVKVTTLGLLHDCDICREGVNRALAMLATGDGPMIVGQLYWTEAPGGP